MEVLMPECNGCHKEFLTAKLDSDGNCSLCAMKLKFKMGSSQMKKGVVRRHSMSAIKSSAPPVGNSSRRASISLPPKFPDPVMREWADTALQKLRFTKQNATAVNVKRQAPAKAGADKKRLLAQSAFDPDRDTYMVAAGSAVDRVSVVLGWDHAVLLKKVGLHYVLEKVYVHGPVGSGHKAFGKLSDLQALPSADPALLHLPNRTCRNHSRGESCPWSAYQPPNHKVDRIVTYGVSSCSFSVLYTADLKWIAISHMSGAPPIPVGFIMTSAVAAPGTMHLIASILPQSLELMKFDGANLFARPVTCHRNLLSRGKIPTRTEGKKLFPQMGHSDIGLNLTAHAKPIIEGNIGVGTDHDYWTLLPVPVSARLKQFARANGTFQLDHVKFNAPLNVQRLTDDIRKKIAEMGHDLLPAATVNVVTAGSHWQITSGTKVIDMRSQGSKYIRCSIETESADLVAEIVGPLLTGIFGFKWIHAAIYEDFARLFNIRKAYYRFSLFRFERGKVQGFWKRNEYREAFAHILGYILEHPDQREHPYYPILTKWMKTYRSNISIPLRAKPFGK